jgi:hypothetical protein
MSTGAWPIRVSTVMSLTYDEGSPCEGRARRVNPPDDSQTGSQPGQRDPRYALLTVGDLEQGRVHRAYRRASESYALFQQSERIPGQGQATSGSR